MRLRIYLTGRVALEAAGKLVDQTTLPGPQGRLALAFLVLERQRPVSRDQLADVLWPKRRPRSWSVSLSAITSKLRAAFEALGFSGNDTLSSAFGHYQVRLPADAWVDVESAGAALHEAEAALKTGDFRRAFGPAAVAYHVAKRPFLPDLDGEWIHAYRQKLRGMLVRALECSIQIDLSNGELPLAADLAQQLIALEPFRETGYQWLMRAHAGAGNRAEALRVYEQCRLLLAKELAIAPSPETKAVYRELLGGRELDGDR